MPLQALRRWYRMNYYEMRRAIALDCANLARQIEAHDEVNGRSWIAAMKRRYGVTDKMINSILTDYGLVLENYEFRAVG